MECPLPSSSASISAPSTAGSSRNFKTASLAITTPRCDVSSFVPRSASAVAESLGVRLFMGRTRGCGGEVMSGDVVVVGHHADPRVRALLAWHGIAHVLLRREAWEHDEGDVWMLTFELACPKAVVDGDLDELVATTWAPETVVRAWAPIARTLGRR